MDTPHPTLLALVDEIRAGLLVRGGYTLTEALADERARNLAMRLAEVFEIRSRPEAAEMDFDDRRIT